MLIPNRVNMLNTSSVMIIFIFNIAVTFKTNLQLIFLSTLRIRNDTLLSTQFDLKSYITVCCV